MISIPPDIIGTIITGIIGTIILAAVGMGMYHVKLLLHSSEKSQSEIHALDMQLKMLEHKMRTNAEIDRAELIESREAHDEFCAELEKL